MFCQPFFFSPFSSLHSSFFSLFNPCPLPFLSNGVLLFLVFVARNTLKSGMSSKTHKKNNMYPTKEQKKKFTKNFGNYY
ncbi:hypothetical protein BDZ91DRAFT_444431 [Kalaharituber pfeilii]|nr:hypothetical protein BDZ91DRAFT_444431 [Kalaharituber pfeilii]